MEDPKAILREYANALLAPNTEENADRLIEIVGAIEANRKKVGMSLLDLLVPEHLIGPMGNPLCFIEPENVTDDFVSIRLPYDLPLVTCLPCLRILGRMSDEGRAKYLQTSFWGGQPDAIRQDIPQRCTKTEVSVTARDN